MLDGDSGASGLAYSLAFSLPGTPVLFYGEEIGMAENLAIEGRYSVRSPMQWSGERTGRFHHRAAEACRPVVEEGPFGFREVNVARQRRDPGSLLNWMERLIRRRRESPGARLGRLVAARCRRRGGLRSPQRLARLDRRGSPQSGRTRCPSAARARRRGRPGRSLPRRGARAGGRRGHARSFPPTAPTGSACAGPASDSRPSHAHFTHAGLLVEPPLRSHRASLWWPRWARGRRDVWPRFVVGAVRA